jgi:hypothetical protein
LREGCYNVIIPTDGAGDQGRAQMRGWIEGRFAYCSYLIAPAASVPAIVASRPAISAFYVPCGILL